jgi:protein-S-isoprenylcysteine O-methyltransferase Ste14
MRRWRRLLGVPLVLIALYLAHYQPRLVIPGSILVCCGESLRLWAAGHLRKEQVLTTGGPYRFIRNPLYIGSLLIAFGFYLITQSLSILLLLIPYFLFCYIPVVGYEEKVLREKFPLFMKYSSKVPPYFPNGQVWPVPSTTFSWHQVWKNKEYNAILGILAVYLFLLCFRR